jgi:hypothetical protein
MYKKVTHNITEEHFEHPMAAQVFGAAAAYTRPAKYPDGTAIPESLPPSYQPAWRGQAPSGQKCRNCKNYDAATSTCLGWNAPVRPSWWCAAWDSAMPKTASSAWMIYDQDEDMIVLDVPLMIRIMEYAREQAATDQELHTIAKKMIQLVNQEGELTMDHYRDIVGETTPAYVPEAK